MAVSSALGLLMALTSRWSPLAKDSQTPQKIAVNTAVITIILIILKVYTKPAKTANKIPPLSCNFWQACQGLRRRGLDRLQVRPDRRRVQKRIPGPYFKTFGPLAASVVL
jgi:hypothetical protein